jgi:hypothetical protein
MAPTMAPAMAPASAPNANGDDCAQLALTAETTLTRYCANCHANGNAQGAFSDALDVPAMIARAVIIPGNPRASKLFQLVDSGVMPRTDTKPEPDEIDALGSWIECGATDWKQNAAEHPDFLSIDDRLRALREELDEQPEDQRSSLRFIDFSQLGNAGMTATELEAYRAATSFLLNSLSYATRIATPAPFGPDGLLQRIDLRSYGWTAYTWELITADYPYAVTYADDQ